MWIDEADYSYALGKQGATRKNIVRSTGCLVEYVGFVAFLSGTKEERNAARECAPSLGRFSRGARVFRAWWMMPQDAQGALNDTFRQYMESIPHFGPGGQKLRI